MKTKTATVANTPLIKPHMESHKLHLLESIQQRILWLATMMIHHANNVRPNTDGTVEKPAGMVENPSLFQTFSDTLLTTFTPGKRGAKE